MAAPSNELIPRSAPRRTFRDYMALLRRRKWILPAAAAICIISATVASRLDRPVYEAEASVVVTPPPLGSLFGPIAGLTRTPESAVEALNSTAIRDVVRGELHHEARIIAVAIPNTNIVRITARDRDPMQAAAIANAFARAYIAYEHQREADEFRRAEDSIAQKLNELQSEVDAINRQMSSVSEAVRLVLETNLGVRRNALVSEQGVLKQKLDQLQVERSANAGSVTILSAAEVPTSALEVVPVGYGVLGAAFGLLCGFLLMLLVERLDDTVRDEDDLRHVTALPVLGVVPAGGASGKASTDSHTTRRDTSLDEVSPAYGAFAALVQQRLLDQGVHLVHVTSASPSDGKDEVVARLALATARTGLRTVVADCDQRAGRLDDFFPVGDGPGLADVVSGRIALSAALVGFDGQQHLRLLPQGTFAARSPQVLASGQVGDVLRSLRQAADVVLLNASPVLAGADSRALFSQSDSVLIVATSGKTMRKDLRRALTQLREVEVPLAGAVLRRRVKRPWIRSK